MLEKIAVKKVSESVAEQLENMILSGAAKPGEKLPSVRELCDLFGVGRSAIRDALTTLKGKGMVDVKQGEGTFVLELNSNKLFNQTLLLPSSKDISELFQVRKILEAGIAEMAAINRSNQDLNEMQEVIDHPGWESDYHFHRTIAQASGNEIIHQLIQFISSTTKKAMNDFHQFIQQDPTIVQTIFEQHKEIFISIKNNNPQSAKENMIKHLNFVEEILQNSILECSKQG
ncbi:FadR/GntR family transcriptional regulator [Bacillus sp. 31A1R]|uniref:FadR/GntR family transcriptional regulator n=1 Tax=Robertmurraya mangrovi TaxID=3098077 RepID=A0ABU5IXY2_9BACI|nr:FadR/GntR family transcriptional regulator [Bacillus sp. 31A1R]MDZ5472034.1 FadR/GntR family transcriptional regulator [Bacillus sp. 31A1R]